MSAQEFTQAIKQLGFNQTSFAKAINTHRNTVVRWSTGKIEIPGPVIAYVRLRLEVDNFVGRAK